ncbi:serine/arginine repetitive matrix protein 1-like [Schistocerca piceifrons]|uniref:serine/arginine repetitive matrix protein 1-like n=1 Tax=Schistocerca piceifrons TaxID=274613 RepID=UPI001F5F66A6|nr:serine/arginine repetitive matrix protein 1-like [Schistocerca piceifrons]
MQEIPDLESTATKIWAVSGARYRGEEVAKPGRSLTAARQPVTWGRSADAAVLVGTQAAGGWRANPAALQLELRLAAEDRQNLTRPDKSQSRLNIRRAVAAGAAASRRVGCRPGAAPPGPPPQPLPAPPPPAPPRTDGRLGSPRCGAYRCAGAPPCRRRESRRPPLPPPPPCPRPPYKLSSRQIPCCVLPAARDAAIDPASRLSLKARTRAASALCRLPQEASLQSLPLALTSRRLRALHPFSSIPPLLVVIKQRQASGTFVASAWNG